MLNPNYLHPRTKALIVTAVFTLAGLLGWYFAQEVAPDPLALLPFVIFYVVLTLNTYPSIQLFSGITPMEDKQQRLLDLLLVVAYLSLAYGIGNPTLFFVSNLFLFILAPLKYILLLGRIPHSRLIKKKVTIDLLGALLAAITLTTYLAGYAGIAAWTLAIVFALANIYWLLIKPMYKIID